MQIGEAHARVNLRLQEIDASRFDDFESGEVDAYLSIAQIGLLKEKINASNLPAIYQSDIYTTVSETVLIPVLPKSGLPSGNQHEFLFAVPYDLMYYIQSEIECSREVGEEPVEEYLPTQLIQEGDLPLFRVTSINHPYIEKSGVLMREEFGHIFCDHETIASHIKLIYIRTPQNVHLDEENALKNVEFTLPDHLHDDIIEVAVKMMTMDATSKQQ